MGSLDCARPCLNKGFVNCTEDSLVLHTNTVQITLKDTGSDLCSKDFPVLFQPTKLLTSHFSHIVNISFYVFHIILSSSGPSVSHWEIVILLRILSRQNKKRESCLISFKWFLKVSNNNYKHAMCLKAHLV